MNLTTKVNLYYLKFKFTLKTLYLFVAGTNNIINGIGLLFFRLGLFKEYKVHFKNWGNIKLDRDDCDRFITSFFAMTSLNKISKENIEIAKSIHKQKNEEILEFNNIKMENNDIALILSMFVNEEYKLDYTKEKKKTIIDIGGNRGDSALYFAQKNYEVYAFEPVPELYESGVKNINLNPLLSDKITFIKKGLGKKVGTLKIYLSNDINNSGASSSFLKNSNKYEIAEITTLENILKEYSIEPYIIKIDCEGCEKELILNSDLSMFEEIYLEYHTELIDMNPKILINKLEQQNFKIKENESTGSTGMVHLVKN